MHSDTQEKDVENAYYWGQKWALYKDMSLYKDHGRLDTSTSVEQFPQNLHLNLDEFVRSFQLLSPA